MPADRLFHPRLGHSDKVSKLSDFEFRVWTQYELSADDFGVMRASAVTLQADNDALLERPMRTVQKALDRLTAIGLVRTFEHQGRVYVYQHDWQSYQKVEYPRETSNPRPPEPEIAACDDETRRLFDLYPGGKQGKEKKKIREKAEQKHEPFAEQLPNESQIVAEQAPTTRARACETAKAKANGLEDRFDRFWKVYPKKVGKQAALKVWRKLRPSEALTDTIVEAVERQKLGAGWQDQGGKFIPDPERWLAKGRWDDEVRGVSEPEPEIDWFEDCQAIHGGACSCKREHQGKKDLAAFELSQGAAP